MSLLVPVLCWTRAGFSLLSPLFQHQHPQGLFEAASVKHPKAPTCGDVAATTVGLLPATPEPWPPPSLPACARCPSPPEQGADPKEIHPYLCR